MTQALLISNAVLWVVVVVLAGVVVALVRQIGVLYERVAPAGALMLGRGPVVGEAAPIVAAEELAGGTRQLGAPTSTGRSTLVFFLSPTCPVCKTLLPVLRSIARSERAWLDVVLSSDGPRVDHEAFVRTEGLEQFPYLLSPMVGVTYQVAKLPYAVLIDPAGVLRAKGLVNTREHLESLFEAHERGLPSLQDYLAQAGDTAERIEA